MNEIIERAAKAIYYGTAGEGDDGKGAWERDTGIGKEGYRDMARAVFQAIAEPTEAMILAACADAAREQCRPVAIHRKDADDCWRAMVAEVLK